MQDANESQTNKLSFPELVSKLCARDSQNGQIHSSPCAAPLPSRIAVIEIVEHLRSVFFPGYFGLSEITDETLPFHIGHTLDNLQRALCEQITRGLCFACAEPQSKSQCQRKAEELTAKFLSELPQIQNIILTDIQAAFAGDPAATSPDETIFCYPGVRAITNYRIANCLHCLGVPILPRMITEHAHSRTGIDIHPGATIGSHFFIDHGTGVVIGETCIIGNHVTLYQGVTLGAKSFPLDSQGRPIKGIPRHPILEDEVVVYAGATILGRVTIGKKSMIGGNVWLTHSVPPGSRVSQQLPMQEDKFKDGSGI